MLLNCHTVNQWFLCKPPFSSATGCCWTHRFQWHLISMRPDWSAKSAGAGRTRPERKGFGLPPNMTWRICMVRKVTHNFQKKTGKIWKDYSLFWCLHGVLFIQQLSYLLVFHGLCWWYRETIAVRSAPIGSSEPTFKAQTNPLFVHNKNSLGCFSKEPQKHQIWSNLWYVFPPIHNKEKQMSWEAIMESSKRVTKPPGLSLKPAIQLLAFNIWKPSLRAILLGKLAGNLKLWIFCRVCWCRFLLEFCQIPQSVGVSTRCKRTKDQPKLTDQITPLPCSSDFQLDFLHVEPQALAMRNRWWPSEVLKGPLEATEMPLASLTFKEEMEAVRPLTGDVVRGHGWLKMRKINICWQSFFSFCSHVGVLWWWWHIFATSAYQRVLVLAFCQG